MARTGSSNLDLAQATTAGGSCSRERRRTSWPPVHADQASTWPSTSPRRLRSRFAQQITQIDYADETSVNHDDGASR